MRAHFMLDWFLDRPEAFRRPGRNYSPAGIIARDTMQAISEHIVLFKHANHVQRGFKAGTAAADQVAEAENELAASIARLEELGVDLKRYALED